jgi:uncharacterized radical SAM superfamily protein
MKYYIPGKTFPAVSITGSDCQLMCSHCCGVYLKNMRNADNPEKLMKAAWEAEQEGARGILISGGCTEEGRVPFEEYIEAIDWIKQKHRMVINAHTGFGDESTIRMFEESGIDIASIELVGSDYVLNEVFHLEDTGVPDVTDFFEGLYTSKIPYVVPHITVGLEHGKINTEYDMLDLVIEKDHLLSLVINVVMPTKGTLYENISVDMYELERFFFEVRKAMPERDVVLGCMRPRGPDIEKIAVSADFDGITMPSSETKDMVNGRVFRSCCAVPKKFEFMFEE